jgi:hypothetical protein
MGLLPASREKPNHAAVGEIWNQDRTIKNLARISIFSVNYQFDKMRQTR